MKKMLGKKKEKPVYVFDIAVDKIQIIQDGKVKHYQEHITSTGANEDDVLKNYAKSDKCGKVVSITRISAKDLKKKAKGAIRNGKQQ